MPMYIYPLIVVLPFVGFGLVLLVDRTRLGLETRAVVDRPLIAAARGINTTRVSAVSWGLAGLLIGIGGILLCPLITLDASQYTELTVAALVESEKFVQKRT